MSSFWAKGHWAIYWYCKNGKSGMRTICKWDNESIRDHEKNLLKWIKFNNLYLWKIETTLHISRSNIVYILLFSILQCTKISTFVDISNVWKFHSRTWKSCLHNNSCFVLHDYGRRSRRRRGSHNQREGRSNRYMETGRQVRKVCGLKYYRNDF